MNGNTVNQLITRQEAAHILKVSDAGVAFLTKRGDLSEVRFSKRRVLYDKQLVRIFVSSCWAFVVTKNVLPWQPK